MTIWQFLEGKKTKIAACLAAFVAINSQMHLVPESLQQTIMALAGALGLYGIRSAITKLEAETDEKSQGN